MKKITYFLLFFTLLNLVYSSDDELQIVHGDDELYFNSISDSESGVLFGVFLQDKNIEQEEQIGSVSANRNIENKPEIIQNNIDKQETQKEELQINTQTATSDIIFDISIEIDQKSKQLNPGDKLLSIIRLINLGKSGRVEVSIEYRITNQENNIILEETETVFVRTQKEFIKRFSLPRNLPDGNYKLSAVLSYYGQIEPAVSEDEFSIKATENSQTSWLFTIVFIIIFIALFSLRKAYIKAKRL